MVPYSEQKQLQHSVSTEDFDGKLLENVSF